LKYLPGKSFITWLTATAVAVSLNATIAAEDNIATDVLVPTKNTPLTAEEVMIRVDERYTGDTRRQSGKLILIDKNKNQRKREFIEYSKSYGRDDKTISYVVSPAEVRGTSFMSYEWKERGRDDETWLYLPQLKKVKRMATTDNAGYFLGSDFTYGDFIGLEVENFDYEFASEEHSNDHWVVVATPKKDIEKSVIEEYGYKRVKYWVDKNKFINMKAQYWLNEGKKVKYMTASDLKETDGIWTVQKLQMVLTQGGKILHASVYQLDDIQYNIQIDDEMFTTYTMEREIN